MSIVTWLTAKGCCIVFLKDNVQKGTDGLNQNMEDLKHNFFFKGYFKNLTKQHKKRQPG